MTSVTLTVHQILNVDTVTECKQAECIIFITQKCTYHSLPNTAPLYIATDNAFRL